MEDNEAQFGQPAGSDNLIGLVWRQVWRFRLLVGGAVLLGGAAGLFFSLITPNLYESVGKLYVRPGIRDQITPESAFADSRGSSARALGLREAVLNELQILSGPALFDKVVKAVGADLILAPYNPVASGTKVSWSTQLSHTFQSWWFGSDANGEAVQGVSRDKLASMVLERSVLFYSEPGTSVIACSYSAHSPETARRVVNAVLEAAREVHREVFDTMSSLDAIEDEMKHAEEAARDAEKALRDFRVEKNLHSFDEEYASLLAYRTTIDHEADTTDLQIERKTAERDVVMALERLRVQDRTTLGAASFVLNPTHATLNSLLTQLQLRELALEEEKGHMSTPEYQRRKAAVVKSITETQARITEEGKQLEFEGARGENPLYIRIAQSLDDIKIELKGLESMKAKTEALRAEIRTRLRDLDKLSPMLRSLELDAQQKRAVADGLVASVTKMNTLQRLEKLTLSSVGVMHAATFQPQKIAPLRPRMVLIGAFGGGAFGVLLGLLLAFRDTKVRSREDLAPLAILTEARAGRAATGMPGLAMQAPLPAALHDVSRDVPRFWASIPYDRDSSEGLKVAFVPCSAGADAGRAGATFAIGLAAHAGERVVYVSCVAGQSWLARRLKIEDTTGWTDVLVGSEELEAALVATPIPGLAYLPIGSEVTSNPHPFAGAGFRAMLEQLVASHRFVIVELPDLAAVPEGRVVLGLVDAAELVVRAGDSEKAGVQEAIAAVHVTGARLLGAVLQGKA